VCFQLQKENSKAGKYYIGNPCSALPKEICHNVWFKKHQYKPGVIPVLGKEFVVDGTYIVDGTLSKKKELGVRSES
jgi:hypothetical protein